MSDSRIVIASGYFDPIHTGHVEYLELAAAYAKVEHARLVVIVNNDAQAALKKGKPFMCQEERVRIVGALRCVDEAFLAVDTDPSVCASIEALAARDTVVAFAKGGDRFSSEVPEARVCAAHNIAIIDGLGLKIQSSSALIAAAGAWDIATPRPA